ncbi:MAG: DUF3025 domain-containing protein [Gallionellaceae bacterium]
MKQIAGWNKGVLLQSPFFAPLHPVLAQIDTENFPTLEDMNRLLSARKQTVIVGSGRPLRFAAQGYGKLTFEQQYEPRCYLEGELQTREHNWHDLFNALVWLTFPKAKAAINKRHYQALLERQAPPAPSSAATSQRGAVRDMNTLLDESGVIVACADTRLSGLLGEFRWKELFWQRRDDASEKMGFFLLGHGLCEKALHPYIGLTGQGLLLAVERDFFVWPLAQRLAHLDGLLADYLNAVQHCRSTRELTPVPLLGVPGWSPENTEEAYYDNTSYFRPGRVRA